VAAAQAQWDAAQAQYKLILSGASREQIAYCSAIGLDLEEFIGIGLEAMKGIADELGL